MKIDTHQHLLYPDHFHYPWTTEAPVLDHAFTLQDYWKEARETGIEKTIFMEVDVEEKDHGREARFFCELSEDPENRIGGVIASARPEDEGFPEYLKTIDHPSLKGIRRLFQVIEGDLPITETFIQNIQMIGDKELCFDICCFYHQIPQIRQLVQACPKTQFVLDHCANPPIASGETEAWSKEIMNLSKEQNVSCKVSGLVNNCSEDDVSFEAIQPFFDKVVDHFGHDRILFGSDWPVSKLGQCKVGDWVSIVERLVVDFSEAQKEAFWSANAIRTYHLSA